MSVSARASTPTRHAASLRTASRMLPMTSFLRRVLQADAAVSLAAAAVSLVGARWLSTWLQLPTALLVAMGAVLVAYVVWIAALSRRAQVRPASIRVAVAINAIWAIDCAALAFGPWLAPNALGQAFLLAQAVTVIAFAELQFIGLRRATRHG